MEHVGGADPQEQASRLATLASLLRWCSEQDLTCTVLPPQSVQMPKTSSLAGVVPTNGSGSSAWEMPGTEEEYEGWDEYTCPRKLHNYKMQPGDALRFKFGFIETENFCPYCFVEWVNGSFPTKMVKAGVDE